MKGLEKSNNKLIDVLKFVSAFLVISIHTQLFLHIDNKEAAIIFNAVTRIAVPFFFACSGLFFLGCLEFENGKLKKGSLSNRTYFVKYIKHIFLLYLLWSFVYFVIYIPSWYAEGKLTIDTALNFLVSFFRSSSVTHFWYLSSLLYAIGIIYFVLKFIKIKYIYIFAIVFYIIGVMQYAYAGVLGRFGIMLSYLYNIFPAFWDAITKAIPFMLIGFLSKRNSFRKSTNLLLFIFSFIITIVETMFLMRYSNNEEKYSYMIFTCVYLYFLFSLVLKIEIHISSKLSMYFRKTSTIIYCIHPALMIICGYFINFWSLNSLIQFIITSVLSVVISIVIVWISNKKSFKWLKFLY